MPCSPVASAPKPSQVIHERLRRRMSTCDSGYGGEGVQGRAPATENEVHPVLLPSYTLEHVPQASLLCCRSMSFFWASCSFALALSGQCDAFRVVSWVPLSPPVIFSRLIFFPVLFVLVCLVASPLFFFSRLLSFSLFVSFVLILCFSSLLPFCFSYFSCCLCFLCASFCLFCSVFFGPSSSFFLLLLRVPFVLPDVFFGGFFPSFGSLPCYTSLVVSLLRLCLVCHSLSARFHPCCVCSHFVCAGGIVYVCSFSIIPLSFSLYLSFVVHVLCVAVDSSWTLGQYCT